MHPGLKCQSFGFGDQQTGMRLAFWLLAWAASAESQSRHADTSVG